MKAIGPYHYKVWIIGEVLDRYENCKNGVLKPSTKLLLYPCKEKGKLFRGAYFEGAVIYAVDIENLINRLEPPLRDIIVNRYFEGDIKTFMEDFNIKSKKEARRLIVRAVNKFFNELEKYKRANKRTA